ncbi:MAG TPA: hypothetical protein VFB58_09130 [Chloroflexota bacterium]|nr:hypothetical protein [Chloroflexota bacterium]
MERASYNPGDMSSDEYHEAILARLYDLQTEIAALPQREAYSFAYLVSREMPEEAARMLVAEMLLDYWERAQR